MDDGSKWVWITVGWVKFIYVEIPLGMVWIHFFSSTYGLNSRTEGPIDLVNETISRNLPSQLWIKRKMINQPCTMYCSWLYFVLPKTIIFLYQLSLKSKHIFFSVLYLNEKATERTLIHRTMTRHLKFLIKEDLKNVTVTT